MRADDEGVESAALKGGERFHGCVHNRFATEVEAGVEEYGHARGAAEGIDQCRVPRIPFRAYRLNTARTVVIDRRRTFPGFRLPRQHAQHEAQRERVAGCCTDFEELRDTTFR